MNTPHITAILAITALSFRAGTKPGDARHTSKADTEALLGQRCGLRRSCFAPDTLQGDEDEKD